MIPEGATSRALLGKLTRVLHHSAISFDRAARDPVQAQSARLRSVLSACRGTEQARRVRGFDRIRTARELQDAAPVRAPDDYAEDVERILRGERNVLTRADPTRLELTGGSSGSSKRVPVTPGLMTEFHRALLPWLADLFRVYPGIPSGRSYWSISPMVRKTQLEAALPVGTAADSDYFPEAIAALFARMIAVPSIVARLPDIETCRYVTLRFLVEASDLTFISVWHPSFLSLLVEALRAHGDRLADDLERGTCRPPAPRSKGVTEWKARVDSVCGKLSFRSNPNRADELRRALSESPGLDAERLWPKLELISLWTDAHAKHFLPEARSYFPRAEFQGKGLLATEGIVSFPLLAACAPVLAVRSHFYEFADPDRPDAWPCLAHELELGRTYEVLFSTTGGLLRYRIGDLVRVEGWYHRAPCLRFIGRADLVSDLVGEKLSAARAGFVLSEALRQLKPANVPRFAMLAPELASTAEYRLFVDWDAADESVQELARLVERLLCEGSQYRYARELGQLAPVRAVRVSEGNRKYEARCLALGQRSGDIKPLPLHRLPGWTEALCARAQAGNA